MIPLKTLLAVACTTAFLGIATVADDQPSDNPSAMDAADLIDTRTPAGIYAEYFPSPEADGADDVAPRLHRNLQTNPVFVTDRRPPIDVQRKLSTARKVNQAKRSAGVAAQRSPERSASPASAATTSRRRGYRTQSVVDLARLSVQKLKQNRAKNIVRNQQRDVRLERASRDRRRAQTRSLHRNNVRERTRLGGSPNRRGSTQTASNGR